MSLVHKDEDDHFYIGPLNKDQYVVINDALELASAWTEREVNRRVANALRRLIPAPDEVVERAPQVNGAEIVLGALPDPDDASLKTIEVIPVDDSR